MKRFGKVSLILSFLLTAMLCFSSCLVYWTYDFKDVQTENVQSVEFYDHTGEKRQGPEDVLERGSFYALNGEQSAQFIEELKEITFSTWVIIGAAVDPHFTYGDYVVRINFKDGSYKLMSNSGYQQTFDKNGEGISGNYHGCEDTEWNDLIYAYVGNRSTRIVCNFGIENSIIEDAMTVEDHQKLQEILATMTKANDFPECEFDENDYILSNGTKYYPARDDVAIIRVDGEYYRLTVEKQAELMTLIHSYTPYFL